MFQNYFAYNGQQYYTGTIILVKHNGKEIEASFVCYNEKNGRYIYQIDSCKYHVTSEQFYNHLIAVTNRVDNSTHTPEVKTMRDRYVSGLFVGWVWYIFLMGLSVILKGAVVYWAIISVIFFNWRTKKIKEEGTYVEW